LTLSDVHSAGSDRECYRDLAVKVLCTPGVGAPAASDRALDRLTKALAAGYKDAAGQQQDKDLEALRDRAEFRTLVAGLKFERP
jgi:hypothetical protein